MLAYFALFVCVSTALGVFEPGCSFTNSQCIYNVKLGHEGVCDAAAATSREVDASCCTSAQSDIHSLQTTVSQLIQQVQDIGQRVGAQIQFNNTINQRDQLLQTLAAKERELNETHGQLANILKQSGDEIRRLREELANSTQELNNCRGLLGLQAGTSQKPVAYDGAYSLQYCSFESSALCNFTQDKDDNADWLLKSASSSVYTKTGPKEDHTFGSPKGHYMMLDSPKLAVGVRINHTARLTSPEMQPAESYCIRFWYNMYGVDVRSLNVYAKIGSARGYPVWSKSGNQQSKWKLAEIRLNSEYTANKFKITFEADTDSTYRYTYQHHKLMSNYLADIAIDDVFIYNTSCSHIPACPTGSFVWHSPNSTVSTCYAFHVTPETWYDAQVTCKKSGGAMSNLVSVNSAAEQKYLVDIIKQNQEFTMAGTYGWYTSGNDERFEHHFDWTDTGTPYSTAYTNWHTGQPNNVGNNQDCVLLQYADDGYTWGDVNCQEKHPFICEVHVPKRPSNSLDIKLQTNGFVGKK